MSDQEHCANCGCFLKNEEWESSLHSPDRSFLLCFPCGEKEDAEIEAAGNNSNPALISHYRSVLAEYGEA